MSKLTKHAFAVCSIVLASVVVYLPAIDNSFISDDFGIFPLLQAYKQNPSYIFDTTSELFRVMSYVYFWVCFTLFGLNSGLYYLAGIALHAVISLLVYTLVFRMTGHPLAATAAGLFFAVYERHQEAVMWISAANELVLTFWCLVFLILWNRAVSRPEGSRAYSVASFLVLAVALFSKEAAVTLAPLAAVAVFLHGYSRREVVEKAIPVFAMCVAFIVLWLSQADRNFFVVDGHYGMTTNAALVYFRALVRLIAPAIPLMALFVLLRNRHTDFEWRRPALFFAAFLVLTIVPYSFLTYQDHLPSRHTYFPSAGLAGLIGIFFAQLYDRLGTVRLKQASLALFFVMMAGNGAYLWMKKEPQFQERAAPTRELLRLLNSPDMQAGSLPVYVCGFPMKEPWWFGDAISRFTPFTRDAVVLMNPCVSNDGRRVITWDPTRFIYTNPVREYVLSNKNI